MHWGIRFAEGVEKLMGGGGGENTRFTSMKLCEAKCCAALQGKFLVLFIVNGSFVSEFCVVVFLE